MPVTSPKRRPQEFGFKSGDSHIVISASTNKAKIFNFAGQLLHEIPCLPMGQHANWRQKGGDTPPGLYKLGQVWNDYAARGASPQFEPEFMQYGWLTFDMVDLEGHEDNNYRAGIAAHGGGSALGWPGAWAPYQALHATVGCVRFHNQDLRDILLPLHKQGTVFVSVHQDEA